MRYSENLTNIIHCKVSDDLLYDMKLLEKELNINISAIIRMALSQFINDFKERTKSKNKI